MGVLDTKKVHINQIGYRPNDIKIAVSTVYSDSFSIFEKSTGKLAFSGCLSKGKYDECSGDFLYYIDFSQMQSPGIYYIYVNNGAISYEFKIDNNIYKDIKNAFLKFLYYQRCGCNLEEKYAGVWSHVACHTKESYIWDDENTKIDTIGGWHDAGDYGRYTVPIAVTIEHLLLAYEFFPQKFKEPVNIPESGNNIPDILNEARYGLEWLHTIQDSKSGGVYHKITSDVYPPIDMLPENDYFKFYISPVSATATADFIAVMSKASVIFSDFDNAFSVKCLKSAQKAWTWLINNEKYPAFKNPDRILTYEYPDNDDKDERFWAACELYKATGDAEYHNYIKSMINKEKFDLVGLGWDDVGAFGTLAYITTKKFETDEIIYDTLKNCFLDRANSLLNLAKDDGYMVSLCKDNYDWGSNMILLKNSTHLIIASCLTNNPNYCNSALDHFHYLLGRNALSQSYVTGYGSKPIKYPHQRQCMANISSDPIPGMVVGGPNLITLDDTTKDLFIGRPPAKCFEDNNKCFSTNEVATYWNTPAIFVSAYFDE